MKKLGISRPFQEGTDELLEPASQKSNPRPQLQ
jgi:hypothetical protein